MKNDVFFALRMIARHRWFSLAVVVTLALGIGINTTVFTLVNSVLFKPFPIPGGGELVTIRNHNLAQPNQFSGIAYLDFLEYRSENRSFEHLEAVAQGQATIGEAGIPPQRENTAWVSAGLFEMLRTPPILGRGFVAADDQPGAEAVALIGHGIWQRRYAGSPDVIGRVVQINRKPTTIVGVMKEDFRFPSTQDIWLPLVPDEKREDRSNRSLGLFGVLKNGISIEEATQDLAVIGGRLATEFSESNENLSPQVLTMNEAFNGGNIKAVFLAMLGAVFFVLLIACANVANMMLSRAVARGREISVRAAVGASRWHLIRQLLVESVLLSCIGGLIGLALSTIGVHAFSLAVADVGKPYWVTFEMDWRAFSYFGGLSVLSGIIFGLYPALQASRVDLNSTLKNGTQSGGSFRSGRFTGGLVVLQFALTVVLLAGAGMMMRSFFVAQSINEFVPADNIFTARLHLPEEKGDRYEEGSARIQFHEEVLARLAVLPGVTEVASASHFPQSGASNRPIEIEGVPAENPEQLPQAGFIIQTPRYLSLIGLPILVGRGFDVTDGLEGKEVAIVTREFADMYWPNEIAVGKRFRAMNDEKPGVWMTVVGVCADIEQSPQNPDAPPTVFITMNQEPWGWMGLMVRSNADAAALAGQVRGVVQAIDPDLPLFEVRTLALGFERQFWFLRVFGTVFFIFALIGLLMASVGIYAVVAQATVRRTREIGIRMALGSTAAEIRLLVLSRGLKQLSIGLSLGLLGAWGASHVLSKSGILVGVSPNDPIVFASITVLLASIALFACWLPADRASRVSPTIALRHE